MKRREFITLIARADQYRCTSRKCPQISRSFFCPLHRQSLVEIIPLGHQPA